MHNLRVQEKNLSLPQDQSVQQWAGMGRGEGIRLLWVSLLALCHLGCGPGSTLSAPYLDLGLKAKRV